MDLNQKKPSVGKGGEINCYGINHDDCRDSPDMQGTNNSSSIVQNDIQSFYPWMKTNGECLTNGSFNSLF